MNVIEEFTKGVSEHLEKTEKDKSNPLGSDLFVRKIANYLVQCARKSEPFAKNLGKEGKSIEDCAKYIVGCVRDSGRQGFDDSEIYGLAMHYYDEDDIDVNNVSLSSVVVNHMVELTDEEKESARKEAYDKLVQEQKEMLSGKNKKKKEGSSESQQSLF